MPTSPENRIDHTENSDTRTTYTTNKLTLGAADATRKLVAFAHSRVALGTTPTATAVFNKGSGGTVTGVPVAVIRNSNANFDVLYIFEFPVPADTSGTITVTWNLTMLRCGIITYDVLNANAATPTGGAVATDNAGNTINVTSTINITQVSNSVALFAGSIISSVVPTVQWTGVTADLSVTNVGSTMYYVSGRDISGVAGTNSYMLKFDGTSSPNNMVFGGVAYRALRRQHSSHLHRRTGHQRRR